MKNHKDYRSMEEIKKLMREKGFSVDSTKYDRGVCDFIFYEGEVVINKHKTKILVDVSVLGHFYVRSLPAHELLATHSSRELDDTPWYADILNTIFIQEDKK